MSYGSHLEPLDVCNKFGEWLLSNNKDLPTYSSLDVNGDISMVSSVYIHFYTKILEVSLFAFAYRLFHEDEEKLTSRIFVYKSSPLSTLPLVIPEYI